MDVVVFYLIMRVDILLTSWVIVITLLDISGKMGSIPSAWSLMGKLVVRLNGIASTMLVMV